MELVEVANPRSTGWDMEITPQMGLQSITEQSNIHTHSHLGTIYHTQSIYQQVFGRNLKSYGVPDGVMIV